MTVGKIDDFLDIEKRTGYKFNKKLFRIVIFVIAIALLVIVGLDGFGFKFHVYITCPEGMDYCQNPYYKSCEGMAESWQLELLQKYKPDYYASVMSEITGLCNTETIYKSYGTQQPNYIKYFNLIAFSLLGLTFLLNHWCIS